MADGSDIFGIQGRDSRWDPIPCLLPVGPMHVVGRVGAGRGQVIRAEVAVAFWDAHGEPAAAKGSCWPQQCAA